MAGDAPGQQAGVLYAPPPGLEALTRVPAKPPVGDICGTPLLVGGADLDDSLATLVSYHDASGPREVLLATVEPDAEAKLYEALALSEQKLVPVSVEKEVSGRLPVDESEQLYEQLVTAAKVGQPPPQGRRRRSGSHQGEPQQGHEPPRVAPPELAGETEEAMAAHYQAAAAAIAERLAAGYDVPYDQGGRVPQVTRFEAAGKVTVTEYVPGPAERVPEGKLAAQVRNATRIGAVADDAGVAHWDGKARSKASGKEYVVDLDDGSLGYGDMLGLISK